ncbi:hypothetical protein ABIE89_008418 [Bradyrhizobium niftali]
MTPSVGRTVSTPSLRAQRSNPDCHRGGILDCFAALAMTEYEVWAGSPDDTVIPREGGESSTPRPLGSITAVSGILDRPVEPGDDSECVVTDTPSRPRGAIRPSFASSLHPLCPRGRREGRVLTWHPRSAAQKGTRRKPHSSIQVWPITRPSLRSGRTAYAVLSREPSSFWPPSPSRNSPASRRLTRLPHPQELDRSNDGQDHTVLPYARPAISPRFSQPCRRSRKPAGETNLSAPFVRTKPWGSRRAIRPARNSRARRCRVHRKPGSRK